MKFSTRLDTDLAPAELFQTISDFERLERLLARRGAIVRRIDPATEPGTGIAWDIGFDWRGKRRDTRMDVTRFDRPETIIIEGAAELFTYTLDMTVIALTLRKARLQFQLDVRPRSMKARLLLQTAKLGKGQLDRKFGLRVEQFITDLHGAVAA